MHLLRRLRDRVCPRGTLEVYVYRRGLLAARWRQSNLVTLAGRNLIRDLMAGESVAGLSYYAVGAGNTAASFADTTLEAEVYRDTITKFERENGLLKVWFYLPTTAANGYVVSEIGEFGDDATGDPDTGTLYARTVLTQVIDKTVAGDTISATFVHSNLWEAV